MRVILLLLPVFIFLLLPGSASAQLVACSGLDCGTCEFVATAKRVFQFLITLMSIVATIILVIVGLRLVTSGGSDEAKTKAKTALWNIMIGLFLVIAAFAIIDTIMKVMVRADSSVLLNWNKVQCLYAIIPIPSKVSFDEDYLKQYGELASLPEVSGVNLCKDAYLGTYFPGEERVAQCVLMGESVCGASFYSKTDVNRNQTGEIVPFSVSPWQINLTVHEIRASDGCKSGPIDCKSAYSGKNYSATLVNQSIFDQCVDALSDPACSGAVAKRIRGGGGGWKNWSAYTANRCGR